MKTVTLSEQKNNSHSNQKDGIFGNFNYLTDAGLESFLVFHRGVELNHFAAFELLNDEKGLQELRDYYVHYLDLAVQYDYHFVAETPTWRANPDWGFKLGYSQKELDSINRNSVRFMRSLVNEHPISSEKALISGNIGPRGDGYVVDSKMTPAESKAYHSKQINTLALADADCVSAFTLNYSEEAIGIIQAAKEVNIPVVISFTTETDGKLPSGESLKDAIEKTDHATDGFTEFFMINCAHPEHFKHVFDENTDWMKRIGAIRANASLKSHAELDESDTLDSGDQCRLANGYLELKQLLPNLQVIGGCCGTDHSHMAKVCEVLFKNEPEVCPEPAS